MIIEDLFFEEDLKYLLVGDIIIRICCLFNVGEIVEILNLLFCNLIGSLIY